MNISQRLRTCAKHTGLDSVIELLQEAADEIDALQARAQQPDNTACKSVQKRLGTQQPATPEPVKAERDQLRCAQADAVMPLIGPLLDAWENADREVISQEPELSRQLKAINNAMEGAQPATGEPVAWMASYVDPIGNDHVYVTSHRDLAVENDIHGEPKPLYTHTAPSVPDDVVRDAERYRFIRDADVSDDLIPDIALYAMESLDEYIDAARLAAK